MEVFLGTGWCLEASDKANIDELYQALSGLPTTITIPSQIAQKFGLKVEYSDYVDEVEVIG